MRNFEPMVHGAPGWDEQYNNDMGLLFGEMAGAKANSVLNTYIHAKNGKAHTLTGEGAVMRFLAKAPWTAGDTITVNGVAKNAITLEGTALPTGAFVAGMWVVAIIDGQKLQFLTQSYANTFAGIQTQLANKVNARAPQKYDLPFLEGFCNAPESNVQSSYRKTDFGLVVVEFSVICEDEGSFKPCYVPSIAQLPEGYFPQTGSPKGVGVINRFDGVASEISCLAYVAGKDNWSPGQLRFHIPVGVDNARQVDGTIIYYAP